MQPEQTIVLISKFVQEKVKFNKVFSERQSKNLQLCGISLFILSG